MSGFSGACSTSFDSFLGRRMFEVVHIWAEFPGMYSELLRGTFDLEKDFNPLDFG